MLSYFSPIQVPILLGLITFLRFQSISTVYEHNIKRERNELGKTRSYKSALLYLKLSEVFKTERVVDKCIKYLR